MEERKLGGADGGRDFWGDSWIMYVHVYRFTGTLLQLYEPVVPSSLLQYPARAGLGRAGPRLICS